LVLVVSSLIKRFVTSWNLERKQSVSEEAAEADRWENQQAKNDANYDAVKKILRSSGHAQECAPQNTR
jgi:hypothetical protein